jgi:N-acyl amino acid synthase of PEP-CTERM/exosortase system
MPIGEDGVPSAVIDRPSPHPPASQLSLYDFYNSIFESIVADTEELKRECFRIRYQVYCVEQTGYEDPSAFPDHCETDEYDAHSAHGLLRHRQSGSFIGTVRIVLHRAGAQAGCFPIHKLAAVNNIDLPEEFPKENSGEISRFCISNEMRRRIEDSIQGSHYTAEEIAADRRRLIPAISLGLYGLFVQMSAHHNIKQWYAEMEPFLIVMQSKMGIHANCIGPLIDFHGKRQLCQAAVGTLLNRCKLERPDVWEVITDRGRYG